MNLESTIFVIGDSHVRAFSYFKHYVPLFIGPAAFNNFLTDGNAKKISSKVLELFTKKKQEKFKLLFLFSGDVEHTVRKSSGYSENEILILDEAYQRYANCVEKIQLGLPNAQIFLSAVLPSIKSNYFIYQNHYNNNLNSFCKKKNCSFVNVNYLISQNDGVMKYPFIADFAHISYRVVTYYNDFFLKKGILSPSLNHTFDDYKWDYIYNIETKYGPFKIWGDIYKDQLVIKDYEKLSLNNFQTRSTNYSQGVKQIIDFCQSKLKINGFTIANCVEGFLAFEIRKQSKTKLKAFDFDKGKINNANILKNLQGMLDIDFYHLSYDSEYSNNLFLDVIIDFEQHSFAEKARKVLLEKYQLHSSYLFLLSLNIKSDTRILKKAGFNFVSEFIKLKDGTTILVALSKEFVPNSLAKLLFYQNELNEKNELALLRTILSRIKKRFKQKKISHLNYIK